MSLSTGPALDWSALIFLERDFKNPLSQWTNWSVHKDLHFSKKAHKSFTIRFQKSLLVTVQLAGIFRSSVKKLGVANGIWTTQSSQTRKKWAMAVKRVRALEATRECDRKWYENFKNSSVRLVLGNSFLLLVCSAEERRMKRENTVWEREGKSASVVET